MSEDLRESSVLSLFDDIIFVDVGGVLDDAKPLGDKKNKVSEAFGKRRGPYKKDALTAAGLQTEFRLVRDPKELGRQITDARIRAGLTQVELAKLSKSTQKEIRELEAGVRNPTLKKLRRVLSVLNVEIGLRQVKPTKGAP